MKNATIELSPSQISLLISGTYKLESEALNSKNNDPCSPAYDRHLQTIKELEELRKQLKNANNN